jgi:hypothetical protein
MEQKQLDISKCFTDALEVYKVNILMLLLSVLIFQAISLFTLLILAGPLFGGYCLMAMNAMRREDKKIELNDMFKMFTRFGPLVGLFFLQGLAVFTGLILLIIPGIILMTMWLYTYFFMVDQDKGVIDSLKASWKLVTDRGFWMNLALAAIYILLSSLSGQIPVIGWFVSLLVVPFAILMITSGYLQQISKIEVVSSENKNRPFADANDEEEIQT